MIGQLEQAAKWDPHTRAHLRLAGKYITRFEALQQHAENAMNRTQIKDAALASGFKSQADLDAWLQTAFGQNIELLRRAAAEARHAAKLSPLQGEAYLYLADLCFLDVADSAHAESYAEQALRVRPYDCDVHYAIGERAWLGGNIEKAVEHWRTSFKDSGTHQLRIIYWLAGRMPAELFLSVFNPDWTTLPRIWRRYLALGQPGDADVLLTYAREATHRESQQNAAKAGRIWEMQANMYRDIGRTKETLECLRHAYECAPTNYDVRLALANELVEADLPVEAEAHYRWCLARHPTNKKLREALKSVSKQRLAQRSLQPRRWAEISSARVVTPSDAAPVQSAAPAQQ
jgi:tetratricopeptide (TPR) repeat protein